MNDLTFTDEGFADYVYWQFNDRKTIKKINNLLEDIKRNGVMQGTGKNHNMPSYIEDLAAERIHV